MASLGTRSLTVSVGGTDYTAQVFACEINAGAADSDQTTFAEASAGGGRVYTVRFVLTQDMASGTLWQKIWSSAGSTAAVLIKPYGNATANATGQPHVSGNVIITEPDGTLLGGDADASATARWQVEVEWTWTAKPTLITA